MRVAILAVGRIKSGPEATLITDYLTRFDRTGRTLGLGPADLREVEDKKGIGQSAESDLLTAAIPEGSFVITLDERGKALTSPELSNTLCTCRDDGARSVTFLIGGADGLSKDLRARADMSISFGRMVWPHMLARVMLAEQLYRAATIAAGTPYHRA